MDFNTSSFTACVLKYKVGKVIKIKILKLTFISKLIKIYALNRGIFWIPIIPQ